MTEARQLRWQRRVGSRVLLHLKSNRTIGAPTPATIQEAVVDGLVVSLDRQVFYIPHSEVDFAQLIADDEPGLPAPDPVRRPPSAAALFAQ